MKNRAEFEPGTLANSTDLRSLAPYINYGLIQTGDVLLTRGAHAHSAGIAKVSVGPYSHAAIFLNGPTAGAGLQLFEADGFGVGVTLFESIIINSDGPLAGTRLILLPDTRDAVVLRHPEAYRIDSDAFLKNLKQTVAKLEHRPYSAIYRLAHATRMPNFVSTIASRAMRYFDQNRDTDGDDGIFCSELVATVFGELGLPLYPYAVAAEHVSPNSLVDWNCHLKPVSGAVVQAIDIHNSSKARLPNFQSGMSRERFVPMMVKSKIVERQLSAQTLEVEKAIQDVLLFEFQTACDYLSRSKQDAINLISLANSINDQEAVDKLVAYLGEMLYLGAVYGTLLQAQAQGDCQDHTREEIDMGIAVQHLASQHRARLKALQYRFTRKSVLVSLSASREKSFDSDKEVISRAETLQRAKDFRQLFFSLIDDRHADDAISGHAAHCYSTLIAETKSRLRNDTSNTETYIYNQ